MNWDGLHCPSWTGGVAATSIKVAKHRQGADGVVVQMFCSSLNNHPVCADSGCFAIFSFWHSHPSCPGGAMGLTPIRSQLYGPRLQLQTSAKGTVDANAAGNREMGMWNAAASDARSLWRGGRFGLADRR